MLRLANLEEAGLEEAGDVSAQRKTLSCAHVVAKALSGSV